MGGYARRAWRPHVSDRSPARRLSDGWKVHDFPPGEGQAVGAHQPGHADSDWLPIAVPGDVHRVLIAAGRIPDPFFDRDESACAWMEEREWWYRLTFDGPTEPSGADERLDVVFEGLDTFATVYLNGAELGEHHNMFRPAAFDVTTRLRTAEPNVLAVRFDPPLQRIAGKTLSAWGRNPERTAMRKAQFGYGWDWGPRLPTIGIWRPVELKRQRRAALVGVHFRTLDISHGAERAAVAVGVEAELLGHSRPAFRSPRPRGTPSQPRSFPSRETELNSRLRPISLSSTRGCGGPTSWASQRCTSLRSRYSKGTHQSQRIVGGSGSVRSSSINRRIRRSEARAFSASS